MNKFLCRIFIWYLTFFKKGKYLMRVLEAVTYASYHVRQMPHCFFVVFGSECVWYLIKESHQFWSNFFGETGGERDGCV